MTREATLEKFLNRIVNSNLVINSLNNKGKHIKIGLYQEHVQTIIWEEIFLDFH